MLPKTVQNPTHRRNRYSGEPGHVPTVTPSGVGLWISPLDNLRWREDRSADLWESVVSVSRTELRRPANTRKNGISRRHFGTHSRIELRIQHLDRTDYGNQYLSKSSCGIPLTVAQTPTFLMTCSIQRSDHLWCLAVSAMTAAAPCGIPWEISRCLHFLKHAIDHMYLSERFVLA